MQSMIDIPYDLPAAPAEKDEIVNVQALLDLV